MTDVKRNDKKLVWDSAFYDSIAFELCKLYSSDQGIRNRDLFTSTSDNLIVKIDSSNFAELMGILEVIGIPNKEKLGEYNFKNECVEGAFGAILLHNPHILIKDSTKMEFFVKLTRSGDLKPEALATILDKYYWAKSGGAKVMYGSQFGRPCLEDSAVTNDLRVRIGLKPLKIEQFKDCFE